MTQSYSQKELGVVLFKNMIWIFIYLFMCCPVAAQERALVDAGEPFGMLTLVDEVIIGDMKRLMNS